MTFLLWHVAWPKLGASYVFVGWTNLAANISAKVKTQITFSGYYVLGIGQEGDKKERQTESRSQSISGTYIPAFLHSHKSPRICCIKCVCFWNWSKPLALTSNITTTPTAIPSKLPVNTARAQGKQGVMSPCSRWSKGFWLNPRWGGEDSGSRGTTGV